MLSGSVHPGPNKDHSSADAATRLSYLMVPHIIYATPPRKFTFSYAFRSQYGWTDSVAVPSPIMQCWDYLFYEVPWIYCACSLPLVGGLRLCPYRRIMGSLLDGWICNKKQKHYNFREDCDDSLTIITLYLGSLCQKRNILLSEQNI